jgi:hypothetical protein
MSYQTREGERSGSRVYIARAQPTLVGGNLSKYLRILQDISTRQVHNRMSRDHIHFWLCSAFSNGLSI